MDEALEKQPRRIVQFLRMREFRSGDIRTAAAQSKVVSALRLRL
jgi:hypothetical protein